MVALVFFRIVISVISLGQKQKKIKGRLSVRGFVHMINIVSKNHTRIRKTERGMVNLPLWQ